MVNDSNTALLKAVTFKIATLKEARKKFSAQLAPDFNLFDYLRSDEMGISKIIADLLDPKGNHGQGDVFLQIFAKKLEREWIASADDWRVVTEQQANGQRRIDMYLESHVGVIGIENKPWATDQKHQLCDYAGYLENKAGSRKWLLIYLGNCEPSADSISKEKRETLEKSGNLVFLTFQELVGWLDACTGKTKAIVVRVFIEELSKFVRININGEPDMSEEKEIIDEIRKSSENIASAFHISNALTGLKQELLRVFHDELKQELEKKGFQLNWDSGMSQGWGRYVGFGVKKYPEQDKYLRIDFEGSGLGQAYWGICKKDDSVKQIESIWQSINSLMTEQFGGGKSNTTWPWYSMIPDRIFENEYKHWSKSEKPWIEMNNGTLPKKFIDLAIKVDQIFDGKYELLKPNIDTH